MAPKSKAQQAKEERQSMHVKLKDKSAKQDG